MKIPSAKDIENYQEISARIREACALLRCTPETLVERIQALQIERESLTVQSNEIRKQLEDINAKS